MEVPVLLLEFEGVLADTAAMRQAALAESLAADGIALSAELLRLIKGRSTEDALRQVRDFVGAPDDPTALDLSRVRAEKAFAARLGKGVLLQRDIRSALEKLSSVARLALVTRASRREVEFVLSLGGLEGMFRPIIALEDSVAAKPARAPYDAALIRASELFPGQVIRGIAVEDSLRGVLAARSAGLLTVLVGKHPPQDAMEADCWIETLADLTPERVRVLLSPTVKGTG